MGGLHVYPSLFAFLLVLAVTIEAAFGLQPLSLTLPSLLNSSINSTWNVNDDPRFSIHIIYGLTDIPTTPVYMNAVELLARYAEMDFFGRTGQRHGIVLPEYPQIEIAVLPAAPSTSVEVRFVIWAIYGAIIDMTFRNTFKENEIPFRWNDEVVGHLYFTLPLDRVQDLNNQTGIVKASQVNDASNVTEYVNNTFTYDDVKYGPFDWTPTYKPGGQMLSPKDVFLLSMGTLKVVASYPATERIDSAFHVGSELVDAHAEMFLRDKRASRPRGPFFQYGHIIEVARRVPAWMYGERRFAEFWGAVKVFNRQIGLVMYLKGPFPPHLEES